MKELGTLSKTLHPEDFCPEMAAVDIMRETLDGLPLRFEHKMRTWEYGLAAHAIKLSGAQTILDVGGGGSVLAPTLASAGLDVTVVDPDNCAYWVERHNIRISKKIKYHQMFFEQFSHALFDAVLCISVIEHVPVDLTFFHRLCAFVADDGILFLTTDFSPSGLPKCPHHLRTYNESRLLDLARIAQGYGFIFFYGAPDYSGKGEYVNDYNFASLALFKQEEK